MTFFFNYFACPDNLEGVASVLSWPEKVNRFNRLMRECGRIGMTEIKTLCDCVRQTAYDIHVYHGHGHLEKVYENALANRLNKAGLRVKQQHPVNVYDEDGTPIGEYFADLFVEDSLIVELKTARALGAEHEAQTIGYLKSSRIEHGPLINFGSYKFEIRKYAWSEMLQNEKARQCAM